MPPPLASVNVLVPNCKIYNDASCDISADGQLLAVFIPSSQRGFPDEGILAIYSLAPHNLGEMLYTKRFGTASPTISSSHSVNTSLSEESQFDVSLHRSERHLRQLVSDGLLRDGGSGLSQDPAASHHRPHGGASLPPAAASRRRDVDQGETVKPRPSFTSLTLT